jgi:dihydrolipoamide dehydrogenase
MPSKEVLSATAARFKARHDERLSGPPSVDLDAVVERKDGHTSNWAAHRRKAVERLAERDGVRFVHDTARFVDDRVVEAGGERFDADYVVVATGSTHNEPDLPGIEGVDYATSADVLDATSVPDSGVVMGFGYVGLELVPYLAELGVDLTVVEHDERPLDEADPAFGDDLLALYRDAFGVEVLTEVYEESVEPAGEGVRLHLDDGRSVEGDELFAFTGRNPTLEGLGLAATPLDAGPGWVRDTMQAVDDDRVFVVGDANGVDPVLHVAKEEGFVAAENVRRHARGEDLREYERVHHHVVFSGTGVYPYARVGHAEHSAEAAGLDYVAVEREASDDGVFKTKSVPEGRAKLLAAPDGTVLGYQGLHYHADAMAKTMQLAVEMELDVRDIPDRAYHPTTPEIIDGLLRAAADAVGERRA